YRHVLLAPELPSSFVAARRGEEVAGVGQLVVEDGWAGIQCMATTPGHRRRGVARAVLHALAGEARPLGAATLSVAVLSATRAARHLSGRSGFRAAHEYCYFPREPGDDRRR